MLMLALLAVAACSSGPRGDAPAAPRMVGLRLDEFPDIPTPPGWRPLPGEDHVAITIANGAVRRLSLAMQAPAARSDLQPDDAMTRYVGGPLTELGWTRVGDGRLSDPKQTWKKGPETLTVTIERIDSLAVIRWNLAANQPPAATGQ